MNDKKNNALKSNYSAWKFLPRTAVLMLALMLITKLGKGQDTKTDVEVMRSKIKKELASLSNNQKMDTIATYLSPDDFIKFGEIANFISAEQPALKEKLNLAFDMYLQYGDVLNSAGEAARQCMTKKLAVLNEQSFELFNAQNQIDDAYIKARKRSMNIYTNMTRQTKSK